MIGKFVAAAALAVTLAACSTTNELALAPNMVRLDTQARGLAFVGSASEVTLQRAAQSTLQRGYTHFRIVDAQTGQGSQLVGVNSGWSASGSTSTFGNTTFGQARGSGFATPIYAPTANVGITVEMFGANERGAEGAFNAQEVLARRGRM